MQGDRTKSWADEDVAQRAIMLQVLRDDHAEQWKRGELEAKISDIAPEAIAAALERLRLEGAIHISGDLVWASRCALYMDALGMVSI
jgi:hypothetical protein